MVWKTPFTILVLIILDLVRGDKKHTSLNSLPEEVLITYLDVFNYFIIFSYDSVSQRRSSRSGNVTDSLTD